MKYLKLTLISLILLTVFSFADTPRKEIAVILRQNIETGQWEILNDNNHSPLNVKSVTQDDNKIRIDYTFTANKIKTFVVSPDDVLNKTGLQFGGDVGMSYANITIGKSSPISGFISSSSQGLVVRDNVGIKSVTYKDGIISIAHESALSALTSPRVEMFGLENQYKLVPYNFGLELSEFKLVPLKEQILVSTSLSEGDIKFFFSREGLTTGIKVNPNTRMPAGNNIWIYGVFE